MSGPILPQVIVEAALTAGQPVSGPGTMTLNSASFGLLGTDFLAGADSWTDISPYVLGFTITRPSSRVQGPLLAFQAGTASITLDNSDGRFDPDNLAGPYVSGGVSQVHAMVPVRIRAIFMGVAYPLFRGFADSWTETPVTYSAGYSEWTLAATDALKILAGITLAALLSPVGAAELTGARVNRILDAASWYTGQGGGARVTAAGDSPLQATSFGDTALNLLQLACDSEIGQLYADGTGAVVFRNRRSLITDARSATTQAVFGDLPGTAWPAPGGWVFPVVGTPLDGTYFIVSTGQAAQVSAGDHLTDTLNSGTVFTVTSIGAPAFGFVNVSVTPTAGTVLASPDTVTQVNPELPFAAPGRADDDTTIANDIQATVAGSTNVQEVTDTASVAKYLFPRTYARADLILTADADALNWAGWVLYISKTGEDRFDSIAVDPAAQPLDLWPQVLGRAMGDRVTGIRRPPGVASPVTRDGFVSGITHVFDVAASTWLTTWTLQDATKYGSFLTLNNAVTGQLDHNALTF